MNAALFKSTWKRNWRLLLIFFCVLCSYLGIIIALLDPEDMDRIKELYGAMGDMLGMFGISVEAMTDPLSYTASAFFGILVMSFTMVFYVMQSTKLIAKPVDDSSLAYTLSLPIARKTLVITQATYLIGSILILFLGILGTGGIWLAALGPYDFPAYLNLVALTFLLCAAMAMLSFFLSVAFCDSKKGAGLATGVPISLLLLSMLGGAGGASTEWLMRISPFGWIDSVAMVSDASSTWWMYPVFIGLIAILFTASIVVFNKKRLPI